MAANTETMKNRVTRKSRSILEPSAFGASVGEALEAAIPEGSELNLAPAPQKLNVVGFEVSHKVTKSPEDLTIPAIDMASGIIVIGPDTRYAGLGSKDMMLHQTIVHRWIYRPCVMATAIEVTPDGKTKPVKKPGSPHVLASRGSMCISRKTALECPRCGNSYTMWLDEAATLRRNNTNFCRSCLTAEERTAIAEAKLAEDKEMASNGKLKQRIVIPLMKKLGLEMRYKNVTTRLIPTESSNSSIKRYEDAVYGSLDDRHVTALDTVWSTVTPMRSKTLLPRIWALYDINSPLDFTDGARSWKPEDEKAEAIAVKAAASGLTIRPFKMLIDAQNEGIAAIREAGGGVYEGTGLHAVALEAPQNFQLGWLTNEDIMGGVYRDENTLDDTLNIGFTRRFAPKPSNGSRRKQRRHTPRI